MVRFLTKRLDVYTRRRFGIIYRTVQEREKGDESGDQRNGFVKTRRKTTVTVLVRKKKSTFAISNSS